MLPHAGEPATVVGVKGVSSETVALVELGWIVAVGLGRCWAEVRLDWFGGCSHTQVRQTNR